MRDCIERKRSAVRRRRRVSQPVVAKPKFHTSRLCIGDGMVSKSVVTYPGRSVGFRDSGRSENERTRVNGPQKSEDRVLPKSRRKSASTSGAERHRGGKAIRSTNRRASLDWPWGQQKTRRRQPPRSSEQRFGAYPFLRLPRGRSPRSMKRRARRRRWRK